MSVAQLDRVSDSDSEGHGFESRRAYHVAASLYGLLHFLCRKHGCALQAAAPLSQKVLRLFGSPTFAATFLQKSPCAHSAAAPLSQKILRLFVSPASAALLFHVFFTENTAALYWLRLHRNGLRYRSDFCLHKNQSPAVVVPPYSQKVLRLFGSPAHGLYKSHCALILMRLLFRKKSRSACLFACECAHDDKPSTKFCERAAGAIRENVTYQKGNCDGSYL